MPVNNSDYALIIGINDYPRYKFPLKGAHRDAQAFADWVKDANAGGGVPEENMVLLLSKSEGRLTLPVHEEIDSELETLIKKAFEAKNSRRDEGIAWRQSSVMSLVLSSNVVGITRGVDRSGLFG